MGGCAQSACSSNIRRPLMQLRTRTLVWSAAGLIAVGTATGLNAPALLKPAASPTTAASSTTAASPTAAEAPSQPIPLTTAPNYRAIVAQNQAAVVGITTSGSLKTPASQEFNPGDGNPLAPFFRGLP